MIDEEFEDVEYDEDLVKQKKEIFKDENDLEDFSEFTEYFNIDDFEYHDEEENPRELDFS